MSVYQRVNPSAKDIDADEKLFNYLADFRLHLFRDGLKFPTQMFKGAKLLEFGAGTGEHAVFYSRYGAECTLVEVNELAVERLRKVFAQFAPQDAVYDVIESSLFDVHLDEKFDIVSSEGVLHHTADKEVGFANLVSHLKVGGFVILGIATKAGQLQRNLQRMILYRFADKEEDMEALAERLFKEHIDRAVSFSGRSRKATIFDTYINPKYDTPSIAEIQKWFADNNIAFYSGSPCFFPPNLGDSPGRLAVADVRMNRAAGVFSELFSLTHDKDDSVAMADYFDACEDLKTSLHPVLDAMNDVTPESQYDLEKLGRQCDVLKDKVGAANPFVVDYDRISETIGEISAVIDAMNGGDVENVISTVTGCCYLFHGTSGLGMNYFIGYKE